jgi:hypothetical protein
LVDRGSPETDLVTARRTTSVFAGFRFPPEVISLAVLWYLRFGLSYSDVEELLAERGSGAAWGHTGAQNRDPCAARKYDSVR